MMSDISSIESQMSYIFNAFVLKSSFRNSVLNRRLKQYTLTSEWMIRPSS